jgi:hypothetical protein
LNAPRDPGDRKGQRKAEVAPAEFLENQRFHAGRGGWFEIRKCFGIDAEFCERAKNAVDWGIVRDDFCRAHAVKLCPERTQDVAGKTMDGFDHRTFFLIQISIKPATLDMGQIVGLK